MVRFLKINPADNVAVCIQAAQAGEVAHIENQTVTLLEDIPAGHKVALCDLAEGENVIKYGYPIGHARQALPAGSWVNEHNIQTNLAGLLEYEYQPVDRGQGIVDSAMQLKDSQLSTINSQLTFNGYRRSDGQVGIRNEVWIIPTVGCVNGIVNQLAERLKAEVGLTSRKDAKTQSNATVETSSLVTGNVDAIVAFPHNYGCSQLGDDHENTKKILRDMVLHPNAGAVLVVGLGCENNQPDVFEQFCKKEVQEFQSSKVSESNTDDSNGLLEQLNTGTLKHFNERVRFVVTQKIQGDEVEAIMPVLRELYALASQDVRTPVPLSELRVGLKCGGSDGFSGITANPLLGRFSDFLVAQGGTTILTEVPEMFGAETILMNRCKTPELFEQTVKLINDFKAYFLSHGEPVGENPSPGNKAGGISTLEDKALGCTQKCGSALVSGVMGYGERLKTNGLNLLSAPGNDLVASTALAAAGCHLVLFTTGRGTPFGTFVPTVKVSTNSTLAKNKPTWIDFNAGVLVEDQPWDAVLNSFIDKIIAIASGEPTNNEKKGYHEIAIFKTGVTL